CVWAVRSSARWSDETSLSIRRSGLGSPLFRSHRLLCLSAQRTEGHRPAKRRTPLLRRLLRKTKPKPPRRVRRARPVTSKAPAGGPGSQAVYHAVGGPPNWITKPLFHG